MGFLALFLFIMAVIKLIYWKDGTKAPFFFAQKAKMYKEYVH
jgi:hypothetical protein